jgi:phage tail tube protein FII
MKRDEEFCAPDSEKNHWNMVDRVRYYREKVNVRTLSELDLVQQFNRDFDALLDNVRLDKFYHAPEDFSQ